MEIRSIDVAVGVVSRAGKTLITQRSAAVDCPGLWEFPGGKQQPQESIYQALCRELQEEIGISVSSAQPLISLWHRYSHAHVMLHVFNVLSFTGEAVGLEGQPLRWVSRKQLFDYKFPAANLAILSLFDAGLF